MKCLEKKEEEPVIDEVKADVFSLGMTMLEICSLYSSKSCYDFPGYQIKFNYVEEILGKLKEFYSIFLIDLIKECLAFDKEYRPCFCDIRLLLSPYA